MRERHSHARTSASNDSVATVAVVAALDITLKAFVIPWSGATDRLEFKYLFGEGREFPGAQSFGPVRRRGPRRFLLAVRELRRKLDVTQPDVLLCITPFAILAARLASVGRPWRRCTAAHGTLLEAGLLVRLVFVLIELVSSWSDDVVVTMNQKDLRFYSRIRPKSRPTLVAPAGGAGLPVDRLITIRSERACRRDPEQLRLLYIGRRTASKGLENLEAAFRIVLQVHPRAELTIVGSSVDGEPPWLPRSMDGIRLVDHVADVGPYLVDADLFCLCSEREGFPMALAEAALSGLRCVAVLNSGSEEVARRFPGHIELVHSDPELIAAAVQRALMNTQPLSAPSNAEDLGAEQVGRFYIRVLEDLCGPRIG